MDGKDSQSPAGPELAPAAGGGGTTYDVFLSYSHRDREWVKERLLPRLRSAGVKVCIDEEDFEPGEYSVLNMQKAVVNSRRLLLVLTPAWVESRWTAFEGVLAATANPVDRRLVPLMLETCEPPPYIAALTYVDFRQPSEREEKLERLLRSLAAAAPAPEPVQGEPVRKGLVALGDLMHEPAVRDAVVAFRIHFERACDQIDGVANLKDLHDLLHTLQLHCYDRIVQEAKSFPDDELAQANLQEHEVTLQDTLDDLRKVVKRAGMPSGEVSWIERDLEPARRELHAALETLDAGKLKRAQWRLNHVLAIEPSKINTRLNQAARDLALPDLTRAMASIRDQLRSLDLDAEKVRQFEVGVETLGRLDGTLTALVDDHDRWQAAELELRLIESNPDQSLEALEYSWSQVKEKVQPLAEGSDEPWAVTFREEGEKLGRAIEAQDAAKARLRFRGCRRQAGTRFHAVDLMLKDQCDELRKAGEPLAEVLRRTE